MASLTKLRRRLLHWERYADRTWRRHTLPADPWRCTMPPGYLRALWAVASEAGRRRVSTVYWPTEGDSNGYL